MTPIVSGHSVEIEIEFEAWSFLMDEAELSAEDLIRVDHFVGGESVISG